MWSRLPSLALLACVAALPGCASEEATSRPAESEAEPACLPRRDGHARICGLAPPRPRAENAYEVATITGQRFSVVLPDELAPRSGAVAVPNVPARVHAHLTTAPPREAADRYCDGFPECRPIVVTRERLPERLVRWDDASRSIADLGVTTLDLGSWTLVLAEPDADHAERVGRAIRSSVDADGYPRLESTDPDVPLDAEWAGVLLWLPHPEGDRLIHVIPGCQLATKEPDLEGRDAGAELEPHEPETVRGGRWCVDGRFWVDASFVGRTTLEHLHDKLRIESTTLGP